MRFRYWLVTVLLFMGCGEVPKVLREGVEVGNIAPEIRAEDALGNKMELSQYKGKVVLLSFWASWCGPCKALLPYEKQLVKQFEGRPFALLGVNSDIDKAAFVKAQQQFDMTWPSFWDGIGSINREWNIEFLPMLILIDERGIIRFNSKSIMDDIKSFKDLADKIEREIQKVLDKAVVKKQ
ncbi:MAG: TlpA family protein disulfide reductase [Planctomycetes bacterium]|nr:TlpA family protein disulfide reductase [Planctomycetota bacterium]NBY01878.1 TlpA family protein disulfide reductase [Planctomycetota bacterium]